jgi:hypothetical protein
MAKFMRKTLLALATEAVEGTPETLAGADCFLIRNATLTPLAGSSVNREFVREVLGNYGSIQLDQHIELSFEIEFAPSGTKGTAPQYAAALLAAGFEETVSAGTKVEYTLVSEGMDSATMGVWMDGIYQEGAGARGNVSINLARGSLPTLNCTFMGSYSAPSDETPPTPDFTGWQTPLGPNSLNTATVTLHGEAICMESISIDLANQTVFRDLPGCDPVCLITDRKPSGTIVFQMTDVATYAWVENARLHTTAALQIIHGVGDGKKITIDAPAVSFGQPSYSDSDGVLMCSLPLVFEPTSAGNDELKLTYS